MTRSLSDDPPFYYASFLYSFNSYNWKFPFATLLIKGTKREQLRQLNTYWLVANIKWHCHKERLMVYHADRFIRGRHAFYRFIPTFRYFFLCYPEISVSNYGTDWFYLLLFYLLFSCTQDASIASSLNEKLLGITLDSWLKFEEHINKFAI